MSPPEPRCPRRLADAWTPTPAQPSHAARKTIYFPPFICLSPQVSRGVPVGPPQCHPLPIHPANELNKMHFYLCKQLQGFCRAPQQHTARDPVAAMVFPAGSSPRGEGPWVGGAARWRAAGFAAWQGRGSANCFLYFLITTRLLTRHFLLQLHF